MDKPPILIVDDEEEVLVSLRSLLRREYEVYTSPRARDALALLENHAIQVVISDQRMPDMNGTDFLAQVSQHFPEVIRLMITGYTDIESVIAAVNRSSFQWQ